MCTSRPTTPTYQPVAQRQSYKRAATGSGQTPTDTTSIGRRSQGNIGVGESILDAAASDGRQLAGGDQKLLPDLGSKSTVGGGLDLGQPIGSLARSGQGAAGNRGGAAYRTKPFSPNTLGPWAALMQAR